VAQHNTASRLAFNEHSAVGERHDLGDRLGVATVQSLFICEEGLNDADQFAFQATFKDTAPSTFAWPFIEPHRSGREHSRSPATPGQRTAPPRAAGTTPVTRFR
jgi:hypothetical protein